MENKTQIWHGNAITRAKYNYTSLEINIMTKVFEILNHFSGSDYTTYQFNVHEFMDQIQLGDQNLFHVKKAIKSLQVKIMEFVDDNDPDTWYSVPIISGVKIHKDGTLMFNIDPFIKPYLVECGKNTTRYFRESLFAIPGKNSKRIYHYCAMFKNTGICMIKIDELLYKLDLENSSYKISMLKERVLNVAVQEINSYSDIQIEYELKKSGRVYHQIIFYIRPKVQTTIEANNPNYEKLRKIGLAEWQAENVIKSLSAAEISRLIYQFQLNKDKIRNPGGWLWNLCVTHGVPEHKM